MMTPESMGRAGKGYNSKFTEFTRIYSEKPSCLICFFEGDDEKYYGIRIRENLKETDYEGIVCDGKAGVIALFEMLKKHTHIPYQNARKAFFTDRDFDAPLPADIRSKVYETPCYAIDNFYTSVDCFKRILKSGFKISEFNQDDEPVFNQCVSLFTDTQKQFHDAVSLLNAWMMLVRQKGIGLNFNDIHLKKFITININRVSEKQPTLDYLNNLFPRHGISESEINLQAASFISQDRGKIFRGKSEIEFPILFLKKLKNDLCLDSPKYFPEKRKISFALPDSRDDILSEFSQYADTPECLREYLKKFKD